MLDSVKLEQDLAKMLGLIRGEQDWFTPDGNCVRDVLGLALDKMFIDRGRVAVAERSKIPPFVAGADHPLEALIVVNMDNAHLERGSHYVPKADEIVDVVNWCIDDFRDGIIIFANYNVIHSSIRLPEYYYEVRSAETDKIAVELVDRHLSKFNIESVYIVGVPTETSIRYAALQLAKKGYHVEVYGNATKPRCQESKMTVGEVLYELEQKGISITEWF